jgi:hypothetical protein
VASYPMSALRVVFSVCQKEFSASLRHFLHCCPLIRHSRNSTQAPREKDESKVIALRNKHNAMKTYGGEGIVSKFLTSVLDGRKWPVPRLCRFTLPLYHGGRFFKM